jgi:hypothetical protein
MVDYKPETSRREEDAMRENEYKRVCYSTEQREDNVLLRNIKTGDIGHSFGCTYEGETVQIRLPNGELDSWSRDECVEETFEKMAA